MKTRQFLISLSLISSFLVGCTGDDDAAPITINQGQIPTNPTGPTNPVLPTNGVIGGVLTEDLTVAANSRVVLTEALIVPDGLTFTIEEGAQILANGGSDVFIAISQGATIDAQGTATNPIVMTSLESNPQAGDWGGLIVLGRAPINSVAGGNATSTSEIATLPYGGDNPADNSGTIRYVRLEYSGGSASGSSENNGFSFYGVGNGTTVEFIQAFEGLDDGVEFFGGTVNVNNVSVIGAQDDSIDWTEGYSGTLTDVHITHGTSHDKGIEADGFNTDIGNNSSPIFFSAPTLNNVTINGSADTDDEAVRLRAGTRVTINNIVINDFEEGFDLDGNDSNSPTGQGVVDDLTNIDGVLFNNVSVEVKNDTGSTFIDADLISNSGTATGTNFTVWGAGWARQ